MEKDKQPVTGETPKSTKRVTRITLEEARQKKGASNLAKLHAEQQRERENGDRG